MYGLLQEVERGGEATKSVLGIYSQCKADISHIYKSISRVRGGEGREGDRPENAVQPYTLYFSGTSWVLDLRYISPVLPHYTPRPPAPNILIWLLSQLVSVFITRPRCTGDSGSTSLSRFRRVSTAPAFAAGLPYDLSPIGWRRRSRG